MTAQRLAYTIPGSVLLKVLPDGKPLLVLLHRASGRRITLTPERTFGLKPCSAYSVSFSQKPDLAIEVKDPSGEVSLWLLDPKYKLDSDGSAISDQVDRTPPGKPKKVDIDKMHAYRDALRDTDGRRVVRFAAILYPGSSEIYSSRSGRAHGKASCQREPQGSVDAASGFPAHRAFCSRRAGWGRRRGRSPPVWALVRIR